MDLDGDQIIGLVVAIPIVTTLLVLARRQQAATERRESALLESAQKREDTNAETLRQIAVSQVQTAVALHSVGEGQKQLAAAVDRLNDRINDELSEVRAEVRGMRKDLDELTPPARPVGLYGPAARKKDG